MLSTKPRNLKISGHVTNAGAITGLQKRLGVGFKDGQLLTQALVHRSYLNEHRDFALPHNERLEFLGDAVLELIITDHLYRTYPNPEGELTSWRSALVRGEMLGTVASELGVGEAILMSKGEERSGGRLRTQLLANAMEAIIGAIYLDQGYAATERFVHETLVKRLPEIIKGNLDRDPKSRLQELAQEKLNRTPHYAIEAESGPDHAKHFTIGVYVGADKLAEGQGASKQIAEQAAAAAALVSGSLKQTDSKPAHGMEKEN